MFVTTKAVPCSKTWLASYRMMSSPLTAFCEKYRRKEEWKNLQSIESNSNQSIMQQQTQPSKETTTNQSQSYCAISQHWQELTKTEIKQQLLSQIKQITQNQPQSGKTRAFLTKK